MQAIDSTVFAVVHDNGESYAWSGSPSFVDYMREGFGEPATRVQIESHVNGIHDACREVMHLMKATAITNGAKNLGKVHLAHCDDYAGEHFTLDLKTGEVFVHDEYLDVDEMRQVGKRICVIHRMNSFKHYKMLAVNFWLACVQYQTRNHAGDLTGHNAYVIWD